MIREQPRDAGRMRLIIITIKVVVALPVVRPEIIEASLGKAHLAGFKRISPDATGREGIEIREPVVVDRCTDGIDVVETKAGAQIEKLVVLLPAAGHVGEPITRRYRSCRLKAS